MKTIEKIFSVKNEYTLHHKYKVLTLFGIKFKFKNKPLSEMHYKLLNDNRFKIDTEFFCLSLAMCQIKDYKIVTIKLKDIKRLWGNEIISLTETHPYKYLKGEKVQYEKYCEDNKSFGGYVMSEERFEKLRNSMDNNFDPLCMPVINKKNVILDGQHRSCILLDKYGEDYEIKCLQIIF